MFVILPGKIGKYCGTEHFFQEGVKMGIQAPGGDVCWHGCPAECPDLTQNLRRNSVADGNEKESMLDKGEISDQNEVLKKAAHGNQMRPRQLKETSRQLLGRMIWGKMQKT